MRERLSRPNTILRKKETKREKEEKKESVCMYACKREETVGERERERDEGGIAKREEKIISKVVNGYSAVSLSFHVYVWDVHSVFSVYTCNLWN